MRIKYVMVDEIYPVLFLEALGHREFKEVKNAVNKGATSAGFCSACLGANGEVKVSIYGDSRTLGMSPKPLDGLVIKRFIERVLSNE